MKKNEKYIFIISVIYLFTIVIVYIVNFVSNSISNDLNDWASTGDYFGGMLNPIFSFFIILLIIMEAIESRKSFFNSYKLQRESQEQMNKQIFLLTPKAEVVYYPYAMGSRAFIAIENIGNTTAYDIKVSTTFEERIDEKLQKVFERINNIKYLPPKYKMSISVGNILEKDHRVVGMSPHVVNIEFSNSPTSIDIEKRKYEIDINMLSSLYNSPEYLQVLQDIVQELKYKRSRI